MGSLGVRMLALLLVAPTSAWAVNKCTVAGNVVYQDAPCNSTAAKEVVNISGAGRADPSSPGTQFWRREAQRLEREENVRSMIQAGRVGIGMTAEEARQAWGAPSRVNATIRASGRREQWVYRRGPGDAQYLYVEAGVVTSIQTQE